MYSYYFCRPQIYFGKHIWSLTWFVQHKFSFRLRGGFLGHLLRSCNRFILRSHQQPAAWWLHLRAHTHSSTHTSHDQHLWTPLTPPFTSFFSTPNGNKDSSLSFHFPAPERPTSQSFYVVAVSIPFPSVVFISRSASFCSSLPLHSVCRQYTYSASFSPEITAAFALMRADAAFCHF